MMQLMDALKGYSVTYCLYTGIKTGIFDFFHDRGNQQSTADEIAASKELYLPYVQIWLEAATAFGCCEGNNTHFTVSDDYAPQLLDRSSPQYQGGLVEIFVDHLSKDLGTQPELMRDGSRYTFSEHAPEFINLISKRGTLRAQVFKERFLDAYPSWSKAFNSTSKICDIGCGSGTFLEAIQSYFPSPSYMGVDQDPQSIKEARARLGPLGVDFVLSDIANANLPPLDVITMVLCLHEVDDQARPDVMKGCYNALADGGQLFVVEFPYPETPDEFKDPVFTMGILDQFFEMTWGTRHMGWGEQKSLIESAGFQDVSRTFLEDVPYIVITGTKR